MYLWRRILEHGRIFAEWMGKNEKRPVQTLNGAQQFIVPNLLRTRQKYIPTLLNCHGQRGARLGRSGNSGGTTRHPLTLPSPSRGEGLEADATGEIGLYPAGH